MKGLREKFRKNEGFTLVEMLIVVAIIAILIAVSIPMVTSSLEKAREAADKANARDAISLASIEVLTADPKSPVADKTVWSYEVKGSNGYLVDGGDGGIEAQSAKLSNAKLTVTYHIATATEGEYFETSYDALLNSPAGGGG